MDAATLGRTLWYADGLRWIGSVFHDAAEHLERVSSEAVLMDPRALREAETYMENVRTRVHVHF
jgi:hypothetical protein